MNCGVADPARLWERARQVAVINTSSRLTPANASQIPAASCTLVASTIPAINASESQKSGILA